MTNLTPMLKEELQQNVEDPPFDPSKLAVDRGVLILQVLENTPAATAGLQPGDVILKVGGVVVNTASDVQEQVDGSKIGDLLTLEINRAGEVLKIGVRPTTLPRSQN